MRFAVLAVALCGCSLYFGDHQTEDDVVPPPTVEPPPDASPPTSTIEYFCEGNTIYETLDGTRDETMPVGSCPYGCAYTNLYQGGQPCLDAPPPVYACSENGACGANDSDACPAQLQCGLVVSTGACSCDAGSWSCQNACDQGLCGAADVQTAIAGDWTGTVTPPSFAQPYTIKLHIGPAGLWYGAVTSGSVPFPFYYGSDGNNLGSRIVIQAQTSVGAYASIGMFDGEVQGLFTGLTVDAHHLKFAFLDSWLSCSRTFYFDLTR